MNTIPTEACRSDAERFGLTQCAECGHLLHQDEVVPVVYYLFQQQIQEHACSETCREKWLNDMRKAGLWPTERNATGVAKPDSRATCAKSMTAGFAVKTSILALRSTKMTLPQNLLTAALCLVLSGVSSTAEELPPPKMILFQKGLICHEPEQVKQFLDDVVEQKGLPEPMTDGCSLRHGANMPVLATPLEWHDNQAAMSLLAKFDAGPHGIRYGYLAYIPNPDFKPAKADIDLWHCWTRAENLVIEAVYKTCTLLCGVLFSRIWYNFNMSSGTSPNWEQLFNIKNICPVCSEDITFDRCDCDDLHISEYDSMDD